MKLSTNTIIAKLKELNISARFWYGFGLQNNLQIENIDRSELKVTSNLAESLIGIPMHFFLSPTDIEYIVSNLSYLCS